MEAKEIHIFKGGVNFSNIGENVKVSKEIRFTWIPGVKPVIMPRKQPTRIESKIDNMNRVDFMRLICCM